jgi:hypothetical protein
MRSTTPTALGLSRSSLAHSIATQAASKDVSATTLRAVGLKRSWLAITLLATVVTSLEGSGPGSTARTAAPPRIETTGAAAWATRWRMAGGSLAERCDAHQHRLQPRTELS